MSLYVFQLIALWAADMHMLNLAAIFSSIHHDARKLRASARSLLDSILVSFLIQPVDVVLSVPRIDKYLITDPWFRLSSSAIFFADLPSHIYIALIFGISFW